MGTLSEARNVAFPIYFTPSTRQKHPNLRRTFAQIHEEQIVCKSTEQARKSKVIRLGIAATLSAFCFGMPNAYAIPIRERTVENIVALQLAKRIRDLPEEDLVIFLEEMMMAARKAPEICEPVSEKEPSAIVTMPGSDEIGERNDILKSEGTASESGLNLPEMLSSRTETEEKSEIPSVSLLSFDRNITSPDPSKAASDQTAGLWSEWMKNSKGYWPKAEAGQLNVEKRERFNLLELAIPLGATLAIATFLVLFVFQVMARLKGTESKSRDTGKSQPPPIAATKSEPPSNSVTTPFQRIIDVVSAAWKSSFSKPSQGILWSRTDDESRDSVFPASQTTGNVDRRRAAVSEQPRESSRGVRSRVLDVDQPDPAGLERRKRRSSASLGPTWNSNGRASSLTVEQEQKRSFSPHADRAEVSRGNRPATDSGAPPSLGFQELEVQGARAVDPWLTPLSVGANAPAKKQAKRVQQLAVGPVGHPGSSLPRDDWFEHKGRLWVRGADGVFSTVTSTNQDAAHPLLN